MLDDFLTTQREAIIAHAKARVAQRTCPKPSNIELTNGIPIFLDQLGDALRLAKSSVTVDHGQIGQSARRHGHDLLRLGLTIAQVVHDYGDICQSITALAIEQKEPISGDEFRTLNLCLDDAIAEAVTEYSRQRERSLAAQGTERLGILAHELRNMLNTAMLSFDAIKNGRVAAGGSTSLVHARSLMGLRGLIDRSLADVRLDAGLERVERISVAEFIEEVEVGALLWAQARSLRFSIPSVDPTVTIEGDRQIIAAAISNLLQNAFKFTPEQGHVALTTHVTADRVLFEVEDECGGLPPGKPEELFRPFEQRGSDRTGLGLGLSICLKAAKANGGELQVRDLPGKGCIFTLALPRKPPPPLSVVDGAKDKQEPLGAKRAAPPKTQAAV
ncbi:MAG TPA: HAMP domain-containing sensor histidine kinase [Polyangiaceae bacterium]|nr:HAMP domain-containing sensor histidine kinase [Polyangiaceae bacterium]